MKRLHIHISVENLEHSRAFYTALLEVEPTKVKEDYIQWLVDDLSLNFAISTRGYKRGLNHLGVEYESSEALLQAKEHLKKEGIIGTEEEGATCCYKASDKYWLSDPTGIVWENYHSMEDIEIFGVDGMQSKDGCCMPKEERKSGCCS